MRSRASAATRAITTVASGAMTREDATDNTSDYASHNQDRDTDADNPFPSLVPAALFRQPCRFFCIRASHVWIPTHGSILPSAATSRAE